MSGLADASPGRTRAAGGSSSRRTPADAASASVRVMRLPTPLLILGAVVTAVAVNLAIFGIGAAAGATYEFTSATGVTTVSPVVLVGFTTLPLAVALTAVALIGRVWRPIFPIALVAGPVLELGSILAMTVPADFDLASTLALALCHAALVPVTIAAVVLLRRRYASRATIGSSASA